MSTLDSNSSAEEEISLQDILDFLKDAWKTSAITASIGFCVAIVYLIITPRQYEAIAQIRMAQISLSNPANPFGTSVEDPSSLIVRMQMPTNYDSKVIQVCGYQDAQEPSASLVKSLKLSVPKGITNVVELKILTRSPELSRNCLDALIGQITEMQTQFAKPFVEEAKLRLTQDNERIEAAKRLITRADQSGNVMSAAYLSARDELSYFLTDREKMLDLINSAEQRGTKLISPIYAPKKEVHPKKVVSLLGGLLVGLFLGFGISLIRRILKKRLARSNL